MKQIKNTKKSEIRNQKSAAKYVVPKMGKGFLNNAINHLPFEMHLPGYQYCGPGTKLNERLKRGDPGINELDKACKWHDIAYDLYPEDHNRNLADLILIQKANQRISSNDASYNEKLAAATVSGIMTVKNKIGGGLKVVKKNKIKKKKNNVVKALNRNILRSTMKRVGKILNEQRPKTVKDASRIAVKEAKLFIQNDSNMKNGSSDFDRVIPVPKIGGVLPLIPIFAGLSALGALAGGSAAVANAVLSANSAKKQLAESKMHNEMMEAVAIGANKHGRGVYLKPYRSGFGLFMSEKKKKNSKNY